MDKKIKRLLFLELDDDNRPFNVMVDKDGSCEDYNFEHSKYFGKNFFYNTGGGPIRGTTIYQSYRRDKPVKVRFWTAEDFPVTNEATLYEQSSEQPYTLEQLFGEEECENGEEFEECGDMEYCSVCDDWYPDYEYECHHLRWDDWWGAWIGTGADDYDPEKVKKSLFVVLKKIGPSAARFLRRVLLAHDYRISWCINDLEFCQKSHVEGRRTRRVTSRAFHYIETREHQHLDRGLKWLETLEAGKTDKHDVMTAGWISEWLADKPSRKKPLPEGFTVHMMRHSGDECELKYCGYPAGTYSIEDVQDRIQHAQDKARDLYPTLEPLAALHQYMNDLVNHREHSDRCA